MLNMNWITENKYIYRLDKNFKDELRNKSKSV